MLYLDLNKYVSVALRNHPPPPLIVKLLYNVKEAGSWKVDFFFQAYLVSLTVVV